MSVKILSITVLLLSVYLCMHPSEARRPTKSRLCCVEVTRINMTWDVKGETYREQAEALPCVEAIIFSTDDGKLCADPKAKWVKDLIANMTNV